MISAAKALLEFIFPPLCLACGQRRESSVSRVCAACRDQIEPIDDRSPLFLETAAVLAAAGGGSGLAAAFLFEKDRPLQTLLHALKYSGNTAIGKELGCALARRVEVLPWSSRITAVVPVPLHRVRLRERGYNQAGVIADVVAIALGVSCLPGAIVRSRPTATQTHLGAGERQENVAGAFAVVESRRSDIAGGRVLVVDDVVTTGATISEAGRALAAAGAVEWFAAAVALAALPAGATVVHGRGPD